MQHRMTVECLPSPAVTEPPMPPIRGSCLCGGIAFEITGPLLNPLNCHCSQCRKQHGAAFRSRVRIAAKDFRWLKGEHLIKYYESPRGYQRGFCRLRLADPQSRRAELDSAHCVSRYHPAIRHRLGAARRPAGAAGMSRLRRQQGAVVRDHRRSAAPCGISIASLRLVSAEIGVGRISEERLARPWNRIFNKIHRPSSSSRNIRAYS
jgi:hypothetical protein